MRAAKSQRSTTARANGQPSRPGRAPALIDMTSLEGQLGYALRRAQMHAYADFIARLAPLRLSPGGFGVLTVIAANPGLPQHEVGRALGIQKPNFCSLVNKFERRGLIVRKPVAGDRRCCALHLTAKGKALLARARRYQVEHEARLLRLLGRRRRDQLLNLLETLTETNT